jgi:hypothetical protein
MKARFSARILLALLVSATLSTAAHAQATRTWVSGVGDDVNPCSRTAPCKTFAGAISKTAAGGEINVLDAGAFGVVTITKSISIINNGFQAGVLGAGTNAIIINAAATDNVVLRGLDIEGVTTGFNGIRFLQGASLTVQDCTINGFKSANAGAGNGIDFEPSGASELYVIDTVIHNNGSAAAGSGILIKPSGTGSAKVVLTNVNVENNNAGVRSDAFATTGAINVTIKGGSVSGNTNAGIIAVFGGSQNQVMVDGTVASNNAFGVRADNGTLRFGNMAVTGNATGLSAVNGGVLSSYGNNQVDGNTADGSAAVIPEK